MDISYSEVLKYIHTWDNKWYKVYDEQWRPGRLGIPRHPDYIFLKKKLWRHVRNSFKRYKRGQDVVKVRREGIYVRNKVVVMLSVVEKKLLHRRNSWKEYNFSDKLG